MINLSQIRGKMLKALEILQEDLATVRTGRAAPSLVENVVIACYGGSQKLKLQELATISSQDHQTLTLHPFDPAIIEEIRTGIMAANLGLNPISDGDLIRINIPPLSEERRKDLVKLLKQKLESGRVMIRQIRHEAMADVRRQFEADEIGEDERMRLEKQIQELTDEMMGEIEVIGEGREKDLLQI